MEEFIIVPITLIIAGMLAGIISSFFGVGGGSIIVPFLVTLYPNVPFEYVVATSLGAIFINAHVIVYKSYKLGSRIKKEIFLVLAAPSLIGALLGTLILPMLGSLWPRRLFVLALLFSMLRTLFISSNTKEAEEEMAPLHHMMIITFIGGMVSALTGLGGGIIMVPMMMFFTQIRYTRHSFLSQVSMIFSTFGSVVTHLFVETQAVAFPLPNLMIGRIHWGIIILLQLGSMLTTSWGLKQNEIVRPKTKRILMFIVFGILGGKIFVSTL